MKSKKFLKRLTALATSAVMIASCVTTTSLFASAAGEQTWDVSANSNVDSVTATLNGDVFTVSGKGAMKNVSSKADNQPWKDVRANVKEVVIEEGITTIGTYCFAEFPNLEKVTIAESVTNIFNRAFDNTGNEKLIIDIKGQTFNTVAKYAFAGIKGKLIVHNQDAYDFILSKCSDAGGITTENLILEGAAVKTWQLSDTVTATFKDGVLTISGTGAMPDSASNNAQVWKEEKANIKEVIIEEGITQIGRSCFGNHTNLEKVTVAESVEIIGEQAFDGCTAENLEIDIKGVITSGCGQKAFNGLKGKVIVHNKATYEYLLSRCKRYNINENTLVLKEEVTKEKLQEAIEKVKDNYPEWYYTENSYKALKDIITAAEAVYEKDGATDDDISNAINSLIGIDNGILLRLESKIKKAIDEASRINESDYTPSSYAELKDAISKAQAVADKGAKTSENTSGAEEAEVTAAIEAINTAKEKLESAVDYTEYEKAKKAVKEFLDANATESKYTTGSIKYVQRVYDYQVSRVEKDGEYIKMVGQATVDDVTNVLNNIIDPSSDSLVLKGYVKNLAKLVEGCKDLIESDYTSDSWKTFTTAKKAAEDLVGDPDNAGVDAIAAAEEALQKAIDTIVINYSNGNGDEVPPIGYIKKGGVPLVIDDGTADDTLAGAASVRVVFDCAEDVNFNPWAAIEIKALVNGVESYKKFEGTDNTETNGTKDWIVELALTNPIASGNSYELSGFTYAWNGAADYVYAITKVEYLDADGKVLKTVSGANDNAKLDDFNEKVDDAKARIESGRYTEDSIKALEEAVAKADALLKESNGRPLPSKMPEILDAIEEAIKALVDLPKGNISGKVVTPNANAEVTVTVAAADGTEVAKATSANGEYTVSDLEDGEYIITFAAEGYVTRSYKATVAGGDITLEAEIHIVGDINGDGNITTVDVGLANAHAKQTKTLEEYDFEVAEVSGDDMITTVDVGIINSTAK